MVLDGVIDYSPGRPTTRRARYRVFDVLSVDGYHIADLSYAARRRLLDSLALTRSALIDIPPSYRNLAPAQLAQRARQNRATGLIGKRLSSPYRMGETSADWIELDLLRGCEAVIGGWQSDPSCIEDRLESVLVGVYDSSEQLVYIGRIDTGFTAASRRALRTVLNELSTDRCPFVSRPPAAEREHARWVQPTLVADINYRAIGRDGLLRHPLWRGLRTDIDPRDPTWSGSLRLQISASD